MKKILNTTAVLILLLSVFSGFQIDASDDSEHYKKLDNYNIYLSGNHSADTADVEGGMAVKGYSSFGSTLNTYTYGAMFEETTNTIGSPFRDNEYVALLLGEQIQKINTDKTLAISSSMRNNKLYGRFIASQKSHDDSDKAFGANLKKGQSIVDENVQEYFISLEKQNNKLLSLLNKLSSSASELASDALSLGDTWLDGKLVQYQIYQSNVDQKTLILNIPPQKDEEGNLETIIQSFGFDEKYIHSDDYDRIIVTSFTLNGSERLHSKKVAFRGNFLSNKGNNINVLDPKDSSKYAEKIVYYFPQAEQVTNFYDAVAYNKFSTPNIKNTDQKGVKANGDYEFGKEYLKDYASGNSNNGSAKDGGGAEIIGSVIAPNASVILSGSAINGFLSAKNLHQRNGSEVHNFKINWPQIEEEPEASIRIKKRFIDENNSEEKDLRASFQLYKVFQGKKHFYYKEDGNVTWITENTDKAIFENDKDGTLLFDKLEYGTYFLIESKSPEGYEDNIEVYRIVLNSDTVSAENKIKELQIDNHKIDQLTGFIKFKKVNEKGEALSGAEFILSRKKQSKHQSREYLYEFNGERYWVPNILFAQKFTDDGSGSYRIENLDPSHDYEILETKAPDGYLPSGEYQSIEISKKAEKEKEPLKIPNKKDTQAKKSHLRIKKTSDSKAEKIDYRHAQFVLMSEGWYYKLNENTASWVEHQEEASVFSPNQEGIIEIRDLDFGKYMIKEIQALQNHELGEDVEVLLEPNLSENQTVSIEFENKVMKEKREFKLVKHDWDDKSIVLEGAEFILEKQGKYYVNSESWTDDISKASRLVSDANGLISVKDLNPGLYTLIETKAPEGYNKLEDAINLDLRKEDNALPLILEIGNIKIPDKEKTASLTLIKHDKKSKNHRLEGAEFILINQESLYYKEGNWVEEMDEASKLVTNSKGELALDKLPLGKYSLIETLAPKGYHKLDEAIEFILDESNLEKELELQIPNAPIETEAGMDRFDLKIIKHDVKNKESKLEGAQFILKKDALYFTGASWTKDPSLAKHYSSDHNGEVVIHDLEKGRYEIIEVKAPKGYIKNNQSYFVKPEESQELELLYIGNVKILPLPDTGQGNLVLIISTAAVLIGIIVILIDKNHKNR